MIKYKDIVHSITPILDKEFKVDVIDEPTVGTFDKKSFYVSVIPINSQASTINTNSKSLMVSIKYFGGSRLENYDMADKLECLFNRNIKVKDRFINISNVEPNFLNDEVGEMLDFLIYIFYFDDIETQKENYENMQDFNLNIKNEG